MYNIHIIMTQRRVAGYDGVGAGVVGIVEGSFWE